LIVTRTPVRLSFLGGGTDYPDYFRRHGGQTLSAAIDKYSYVTVNPLAALFEYSIRVSYSRLELVSSVDDVQHPAVRECLRFLGIRDGVEINYVGDLPARSGLGSSSSFTVCLLHALHAMKGEVVTARRLAEEAVVVEHELIKERVGLQDQYIAAFGGILHLTYLRDESVRVAPVPMVAERQRALRDRLMLFYTGTRRHAHAVLDEQLERTRLGVIDDRLAGLASLVGDGLQVLTSSTPLAAFGELLHAAWLLKRDLSSKVSNSELDAIYDRARREGAIGGKLLGAGSGGFFLFYVEPEHQGQVQRALGDLKQVSFDFEPAGSSVLFYLP
jgi:D-glycero-alpha-D-manno-heptose-7-phosphate kinase